MSWLRASKMMQAGRLDRDTELLPLLWLVVFVASGIGTGMAFEVLQLHAGPARYETFFLQLLGYWAQVLCSGCLLLRTGTWHVGVWTPASIAALFVSAALDCAAQALAFVSQTYGGYTLFVLFNSSVTLFSCLFALLLPWTPRPRPKQWCGVFSIVLGIVQTAIPNPVVARISFSVGLTSSLLSALSGAASFPVCELIFHCTTQAPTAEMASFCGSLITAGVFTAWTAIYTVPRWGEAVVAPIYQSAEPSVGMAVFGYVAFALMVGLHGVSFWKSVARVGTVPTAVAKGAQQAGILACAHLLFCSSDPTECLFMNGQEGDRRWWTWKYWQKTCALIFCTGGVMLFALGRKKPEQAPAALPSRLTKLVAEGPRSEAGPSQQCESRVCITWALEVFTVFVCVLSAAVVIRLRYGWF